MSNIPVNPTEPAFAHKDLGLALGIGMGIVLGIGLNLPMKKWANRGGGRRTQDEDTFSPIHCQLLEVISISGRSCVRGENQFCGFGSHFGNFVLD